jgi:urease accessory protein
MSVAGLLLGDSRFPAGGHAHSGGVEPAVTAGRVGDLGTLEVFLRGRLRTAGLVAAAVAAAACARGRAGERGPEGQRGKGGGEDAGSGSAGLTGSGADGVGNTFVRDYGFWSELDAEVDARMPSPAQRSASRRQGRALMRAARVAWADDGGLAAVAATVRAAGAGGAGARGREYRGGAHHAVVLGATAAAAGCVPGEAARIAAYQAVAGAVNAAVRLLALDPMRATGVLAGLAGEIDEIAAAGAGYADGPLSELPCPSAPALDLLAEAHMRAEVRLFES